MKYFKKELILLVISFVLIYNSAISYASDTSSQEAIEADQKLFAGELFGVKVPIENYHFVKSAVMLFGNKWGAYPKAEEEREEVIWEQLLLSFAAYKENVTVPQEELEAEITNSLSAENAKFDWKKDKEAYAKWLKEKTGVSPELFENQIRHLIQLQKLRDKVKERIEPAVSDEEAMTMFLNEQSALGVELAEFESEAEAEPFYKKVSKNKKLWERESKSRPKGFKRPGFVSVQFLVDIWKIPQDAANKMLKKEAGEFYPPRPIYKGYAVFKVLETRPADESKFSEARNGYMEKVKLIKKNEGLNNWIKKITEEANIVVYITTKKEG